MNLAALSIRRPVTTVMVFISLTVMGLLASRMLPLEFFPEVDAPFIGIQIPFPGASPKEVEREIVRPVEEALAAVSGIDNLYANADGDGAGIFLVFKWGEDVGLKLAEVRDRLDAVRAELPSDVRRINVFKFNTGDQPMLRIRLSSTGGDLSGSYELLERRLKRPLERIPGVARVDLAGVEPYELKIELLPERISAHSIDLNRLSQQLAAANFSVSAGLITDGAARIRVQPVGDLTSLDQIGGITVAPGVRLRDIAEIKIEARERREIRVLNGRPAVGVEIYRERGANLVETGRLASAELARIFRSGELAGIEYIIFDDQPGGVTESLKELRNSGLIGALLSLIVLYLFLRHWPSTLMVTLAVPTCMAITLGAMYFLGASLNVLSMMGLLLALGMLVDNAVVVTESIYQQRDHGVTDPVQAAIKGTTQVGLALSAGTLTTIIVFLPNIFGGTTQVSLFLYYVAVPLTVALLASWLVALTLIPMVASRVTPPTTAQDARFTRVLRERYARLLAWTLDHRWKTVFSIIAVLVLAGVVSFALPWTRVKFDFFAGDDQREFRLGYQLNANYRLEERQAAAAQIERYLLERAEALEIDIVYTYVGDFGMNTFVQLKPKGRRSPTEVQEEIRKAAPKLAIGELIVGQRGGGPGGGGGGSGAESEGVRLNLVGDSAEVLAELAPRVVERLAALPELRDVRTEEGDRGSEIQVRVDRERAAALGFSSQQVANLIAVALRGAPLREFRRDDSEIETWLRFRDAEKLSLDQLSQIRVTRADGTSVPLSTLVVTEVQAAATRISRENRQTALAIVADKATPEIELSAARKAIEAALKDYPFPAGYGFRFGSDFEREQAAGIEMLFNSLLAIILIFAIMAALFESVLAPLAILCTISFAIFGAILTFALTGTTFSIMAWIGCLILIGVIVNNGIVLIEHVNTRRRDGLNRREALIEGASERLRPIMMTTATTVLGLLPLCFSAVQIGGDGPPYYPMARAIAGGQVFGTGITLIVLPTLHAIIDDFSIACGRVARAAIGQSPRPAEA
jgi:HAE1 family hydrophobic/amphiphilic exporter-1